MTEEQEKNIKEFQESGLLWFVNTFLHAFGWALTIDFKDKSIISFYPMKTKFRGFSEESNDKGYIKVSKYMKENANRLLEEAEED